jgi:hypothetical protein
MTLFALRCQYLKKLNSGAISHEMTACTISLNAATYTALTKKLKCFFLKIKVFAVTALCLWRAEFHNIAEIAVEGDLNTKLLGFSKA